MITDQGAIMGFQSGIAALAVAGCALAWSVVPADASNPVRPLQHTIVERGGPGNQTTLYVHGTQGPDSIRIDRRDGRVFITSPTGDRLQAGVGCQWDSRFGAVRCNEPFFVHVDTYGGDDKVIVARDARRWDSRFRTDVWLGPGNDTAGAAPGRRAVYLLGGDGDDLLAGSLSREALWGGPGDDVIRSGGGADYIDGGDGAFEPSGRPMWRIYVDNRGECAARTNGVWDRYDEQGGDGNDTLDLGSVRSGVLADLNLCRLGYFGTRDLALVHGIENVSGTRFNDRLVGDGDANRLDAGPGRDWLSGEGGRDRLYTRDGQIDAVKCGDGEDEYVMDGTDERLGC
jgi:RTX calcium-binding nonapeptide repeat (4 copies)